MPAAVFGPMARVFKKTFGEPGNHYWQRHDRDEPDAVTVIFNPNYTMEDSDGIIIVDGKPVVSIANEDILRIAPDRAALEPKAWVSNKDLFILNGVTWCVECCRPDGFAMCVVEIFRKKNS